MYSLSDMRWTACGQRYGSSLLWHPRKKNTGRIPAFGFQRFFYFLIVQYFCFWMWNCILYNFLRDSTQSLFFSEEVADEKRSSLWSEIFAGRIKQHTSLATQFITCKRKCGQKLFCSWFSRVTITFHFCKKLNHINKENV